MLTVAVLLLISFSTFFPGLKFKDNWDKANLIVTIKDIVLTIDRTGKLYEFSFYRENLDSFLSGIFTSKNVVWWSGTEGAAKPIITMACNCSDEEIGNLTSWFNNLVVNQRNVSMFFVKSQLIDISDQTDGLIIFGYKNLTLYASSLEDYVAKGKGIVYIADLRDVDSETKKIFGIDLCSKTLPSCGWATASNITFITPTNSSVANYEAWKLFFHFPETIKAKYEQDSVPLDSSVQACAASPVYSGTIRLRDTDYNFWTCNETNRYKLYLDTDGNGKADKVVSLGDVFELSDSTFSFSYALDSKTIAIKYQGATVSYGFKYKKPITIDNTKNSNILTDYQVLVTIDTASLISAGKMRSDCGDIRFTDSDGITQLRYWLESGCNSASTKIWVKVPNIPASSTKTIYMYYGNPSATSASNGTATFDFFDDFGDGDISDWNRYCANFQSIDKGCSQSVDSTTYVSPPYSLSLYGYASCQAAPYDGVISGVMKSLNLPSGNYKIDFDIRSDVLGFDYYTTAYSIGRVYVNNTEVYVNQCSCSGRGCTCTTGWKSGSVLQTGSIVSVNLTGWAGDCTKANTWFDNFRIRKYTSPEPTTSIGAETTIAGIATYNSYNFTDFLKDGGTRIYVIDNNVYRIVVHRGNYSNSNYPVPAATVNPEYRSAWIANFARNGLDNVGDDEKQLLLSLLLYASDKSYRQGSLFKIGYQVPYINVKNDDMYEVYKFYLGLGYPY